MPVVIHWSRSCAACVRLTHSIEIHCMTDAPHSACTAASEIQFTLHGLLPVVRQVALAATLVNSQENIKIKYERKHLKLGKFNLMYITHLTVGDGLEVT